MTGSQKFSSYPVSSTRPFGRASALPLCSKDNSDLLSVDKLFHYYYHCCKPSAYSNCGEICRCDTHSCKQSDLQLRATDTRWTVAGGSGAVADRSALQGQRSSGVTQVHDQQGKHNFSLVVHLGSRYKNCPASVLKMLLAVMTRSSFLTTRQFNFASTFQTYLFVSPCVHSSPGFSLNPAEPYCGFRGTVVVVSYATELKQFIEKS